MLINLIYVGLGGAVGAVMRYIISLLPLKSSFPLLTLVTNLLGAILIGIVVGAADRYLSDRAVLFWKTGVCGGFTTFSTFSLEALLLFEQGRTVMGLAYVLLSVVLCIVGVAVGRMIIS